MLNDDPQLPTEPLTQDQLQGFEAEGPPLWVMQEKMPNGTWMVSNSPRSDRDEVTRIQAFHLRSDPDDDRLRILKRVIVWTVDEVPGHGEGKTPPEEILARNEEITKRLLEQEEKEEGTET